MTDARTKAASSESASHVSVKTWYDIELTQSANPNALHLRHGSNQDIDYLLQVAEPVEVWFTTAGQKLEHHWADLLEKASQFRILIPRFGSSDYHRSRLSHLFYSKRRPTFAWFGQQIEERFEDVQAQRYVLVEVERGSR